MDRFGFRSFRLSTDGYQDYQRPQDDAARAMTIHDASLRPCRFDNYAEDARIGNGTRCHKNVIVMVVNDGKMRTKGE
jgi:hypothetical protein